MTVMLLLAGTASATVITFDANGGEGTMSTQTISDTEKLTANSFTRDGYLFVGWNRVADGTGTAYTNESSITAPSDGSDITLYAQWAQLVSTITPTEPSQDGDGNYLVGTAAELYWIMSNVSSSASKNVILTADIVINENVLAEDYELNPSLKTLEVWTQPDIFKGVFNGNTHSISGICQINDYAGFVNNNYGTIENLEIHDSYFKGTSTSGNSSGGSFARYNFYDKCYIRNCAAFSKVDARNSGGIVGLNDGYIYSSMFVGKATYGVTEYNSYCQSVFFDSTVSGTTTSKNRKPSMGYAPDGSLALTTDEFKTGRACYGLGNSVWYQTIGTDTYPTLKSTGHGTVSKKSDDTYTNEHVHSLTLVAATASTCVKNGNNAYYKCSCGRYFSDAEGNTEIEDKTSVVLPTDENVHTNINHVEATTSTCTVHGNIAYYKCGDCGQYFSDEAGTIKITDKTSVILDLATTHTDIQLVPGKAATCLSNGHIAYYKCQECDRCFSDENGENEIEESSTIVVDANAHSINDYYEAVAPTCTTDGNIEYYVCGRCEKTFSDSEGQNEVSSVGISAIGHDFSGTWSDITGGRVMSCENGCGKAYYTMDAAGKNAIALTLASELDGVSKLTFPYIEGNAPVLTPDGDNYNVVFYLDGSSETMTISKSMISKVSLLWAHDFTAETQNADKSYSHKCSVTDCDVMDDDLYVKINGENVEATKDGDVLKVSSLVLTDDKGYSCEAVFTAGTATYSRTTDSEWGTLCLPIPVDVDADSNCEYYILESIADDAVVLCKITDATIPAGTPVIVHCTNADSGISIAENDVEVSTMPAEGSSVDGLTLVGTFSDDDSDKVGYFIDNGSFINFDGNEMNVAAFRAYLAGSTSSDVSQLTIRLADDISTAIDMLTSVDSNVISAVYDILGRRVNSLQHGVNIVKFSNGQTKKIIIK